MKKITLQNITSAINPRQKLVIQISLVILVIAIIFLMQSDSSLKYDPFLENEAKFSEQSSEYEFSMNYSADNYEANLKKYYPKTYKNYSSIIKDNPKKEKEIYTYVTESAKPTYDGLYASLGVELSESEFEDFVKLNKFLYENSNYIDSDKPKCYQISDETTLKKGDKVKVEFTCEDTAKEFNISIVKSTQEYTVTPSNQ